MPVKFKKQWGVVRANKDAKITWQFEGGEEGMVGAGLIGKDVIVIVDEWEGKVRKAKAILLNGETGKKIREQIVFEGIVKGRSKLRVQNDENGVFKDLLVISHEDKKLPPAIHVIFFDDQLRVLPKVTLRPTYTPLQFAGSLVSKSGEIVLADFSEEQLVVTRFGKDGKELNKLSTILTRKSDDFQSVLQFDINNPDAVIIALKYNPAKKDWVTRVLRFDLKAGKVISSPDEPLDKSHAQSYKLSEVKGVKDGNVKWIEEAVIAGIVQWNDKTFLIREIRTSISIPRSSGRSDLEYDNHACMISVYDAALKAGVTTGFQKRYHSNLPSSLTIGFHVYNDKLIIIAPASAGLTSSELIFATMDLKGQRMEKVSLLSGLRSGGFTAVESNATLWFDESFLIQELRMGKGLINPPLNCVLHQIEL